MRAMAPKNLHIHIPDFYRCPISLDLMHDPVILCTGQTYDRSSIEKWLADGNHTCPVTRQPLQDRTLIPNNMLLRLIQSWCVANRPLGIERIPTPKHPANPEQVALLVQNIASNTSKLEKIGALKRLGNLAKESERNRLLMLDMDIVPVLISVMFNETEEKTRKTEVAEEVIGVLANFPLCDKNMGDLVQPQKLRFLSRLLREGSVESRMNAACLVETLTSSEGASDQIRCLVGSTEGMMESLVGLMKETNNLKSVKLGIKALFGSCLAFPNLERAVRAGAVVALLDCLLLTIEKSDVERVLATIELLCKTAEGREEVAGHALIVALLKKMMLKVSNQASENAAGILLAICNYSEEVQEAAVEEGMFTQLLLLLQSECTLRAKKKARSLLKLLSDNWADHPCVKAPGGTHVLPF